MARPIPMMDAPPMWMKAHITDLVKEAFRMARRGELPPPPAYYARANPPSLPVKRIVIRLLSVEAGMYESHLDVLDAIAMDGWVPMDLRIWQTRVYLAYNKAEKLFQGKVAILEQQKQQEAKSPRKSYGTKRLFQKDLSRFEITKESVRKALEKDTTEMPKESWDFLGLELTKHHDLVTRFEAAKKAGAQKLRAFLISEGYSKVEKYLESLKLLNAELDSYYRFHRKNCEEADEAKSEARRQIRIQNRRNRDRIRAQAFVQNERMFEDRGKELLLKAITTDDRFLDKYMGITTATFHTWTAASQSKREIDLVVVMTDYVEKQKAEAEAERKAALLEEEGEDVGELDDDDVGQDEDADDEGEDDEVDEETDDDDDAASD